MMNSKVKCMKVSKKYDYHYWDGNRKFGYGGFKYINGYSQSRIVDFVYENANNDTQAEKILNIIL